MSVYMGGPGDLSSCARNERCDGDPTCPNTSISCREERAARDMTRTAGDPPVPRALLERLTDPSDRAAAGWAYQHGYRAGVRAERARHTGPAPELAPVPEISPALIAAGARLFDSVRIALLDLADAMEQAKASAVKGRRTTEGKAS